jgi:predicted nucleotidyltransferase
MNRKNMHTELIKSLGSFFSDLRKDSEIQLAYLFGSQADGTQGPISDYDIAVLFTEKPTSQVKYYIAHKLGTLLKTNRVDLILLNYAPIELSYSVIANGIVVYNVNTYVRVEFEASILSRYGDYLPILRRQRNEILEGHNYETGIQRYRTALRETQQLLAKIRAI